MIIRGRGAEQRPSRDWTSATGSWSRGPVWYSPSASSLAHTPSARVSKIAVGQERLEAVLTQEGQVYVDGKRLDIAAVADICCGDDFLLCRLENGNVLAHGDNAYGQCGAGEAPYLPGCQHIALPEKAVDIACGALHSVVVLASGRAMVAGWLAYSQGGGESELRQRTFRYIDDAPFPIGRAACGIWHSVFLSQKGGHVWAVGYNGDGQIPPSGLTQVRQIAAAHRLTLAVLQDGTCRAWGFRAQDYAVDGPVKSIAAAFGWTVVFHV